MDATDLDLLFDTTDFSLGQVVRGRYRIVGRLADGGMSRLYLAKHLTLDIEVVLKVSRERSKVSRERFEREALVHARARHGAVVRPLDFDVTEDGAWFLVTEYIEGCDLAELLDAEGPLEAREALRVLGATAQALDALHAQGIVHRDVKPANVMVGDDERVKLIDFGLAMDDRQPRESRSWTVFGTPEYMAPEQALGLEEAIGPWTDRYSFAAMALELITGHRAYPSLAVAQLLLAIVEQPPRRPSSLGMPSPVLDAVFAKAMSRDRERRYPTCMTFVNALAQALSDFDPTCREWMPVDAAPTLRLAPDAEVRAAAA